MQPTPKPVVAPTPYPSYKPTPQPIGKPVPTPDCYDEIYTEFNCYGKGEAIEVYFDQCYKEPYDWIGIYPSYVNGDDLPLETGPWQFLCGSQHCHETADYGFVVFKDESTGPWPLSKGPYKVFLIREGECPYTTVAESDEFWVKDSVDECIDRHPHPTPSPHKPYPTPSPHKPYPTPSPHKPTPSPHKPTPYPTDYHPDCTSYVTTDAQCYDTYDPSVIVDFKSCDAGEKDWIGIYHADDDPHNLGYPIDWAWIACEEDTDCGDGTAYSSTLGDLSGYVEFVGLPHGEYRAHLIKHLYPFPSYEAEASSDVFYVKQECDVY